MCECVCVWLRVLGCVFLCVVIAVVVSDKRKKLFLWAIFPHRFQCSSCVFFCLVLPCPAKPIPISTFLLWNCTWHVMGLCVRAHTIIHVFQLMSVVCTRTRTHTRQDALLHFTFCHWQFSLMIYIILYVCMCVCACCSFLFLEKKLRLKGCHWSQHDDVLSIIPPKRAKPRQRMKCRKLAEETSE